jgi:thioredoxin reductase (NADPH)
MDPKSVVILGDGPTGLSAALLLAKKGYRVDVVGLDQSAVHKAMLHNYLGEELPGPEFLAKARAQAQRFGANLHAVKAIAVRVDGELGVDLENGSLTAQYLVLATGFDKALVAALGLEMGPLGIRVDLDGRTSKDRVYAGGAAARGAKSQVATGVGDGAAIAVDILSRDAGKPTHDYDVLPKPAA